MNSEINVRKVSFDSSKGYIHQVNYTNGNTYSDIMSKISYVCRTYRKGQIIMINKDVYPCYVATCVPQLNVVHLKHMHSNNAIVPDIRSHLKEILADVNKHEFVIVYDTVVLKASQKVKNHVTVGVR